MARSDLYCFFYARALQLLKHGGMHVFVCSNSWLDVGYGAKLQEYLLNNAHVLAVYESAVERQFSTADINTIISLISKSPGDNESETRFVSLRDQFDTALSHPAARKEILRNQATLRAGGTDGTKFVGEKWGGKYLRAPDIYHHIMAQCADRLVRLGNTAVVKRGATTGANKFFFLTQDVIEEWGIELDFCEPIMTTPQESRRIAIDATRLPKRLFLCQVERSELLDTGALEYIEWGESQGYHLRKTTAARPRWYDLGDIAPVYLGMNKLVDTTARTFIATQKLMFSDNFQVVQVKGNSAPILLCAALNSSLFQLMLNTESRANFGEGVLEIQTYETANLAIVRPKLLRELDAKIFDSDKWDVLIPSPERRLIDTAVFDALRLTQGEQDAVYEGVSELVGNRKRRANSV